MDQIGPTVRRRRQDLGLTLDALAQAAGCSKAYLSAIENDRLNNPPSRRVLEHIAAALSIDAGDLIRMAEWQRTPAAVRAEVEHMAAHARQVERLLHQAGGDRAGHGRNLDAMYRNGQLHRWVDDHRPNIEPFREIGYRVPLINKVAAGYPTDFTDLDYPARVADEYLTVPGVTDATAFAARVVGSSMEPDYREGEIIVFSPQRPAADGEDCFVRLLPDHKTTFKRVFFEDGGRIRLQPLNDRFEARTVQRVAVDGLYPAILRLQQLGQPVNGSV